MSLGRCEGYRYPCQAMGTRTVESTDARDAWVGCEDCMLEALIDRDELAPGTEVLPRRSA